ncbi:MAG TPA: helix-hairpin-helix domain-containing protein [Myxococcaceae bacterium]
MSGRGFWVVAALLCADGVHAAPPAPGAATAGKAKRAAGTGVLNLNTATLDQIDALPGVSPTLAAAVVAERTAHPFARPEDVTRVQGMGKRRFERLRPHLTVTGPSTFVVAKGRAGPTKTRSASRPGPTHP